MPFTEVGGEVSLCFESLGDRCFMGTKVVAMVGDIDAHGIASGHHACASGRTNRSASVETVKDDGPLRHCVKIRGLDVGMTGKATVAVTLIVGEYEKDVGFRGRRRLGRKARVDTNEDGGDEAEST